MKKTTCLLVALLVWSTALSARPRLILGCRENAGLFSILFDVTSLCLHYDLGDYDGIKVDFLGSGLYYDPDVGLNWWTYYFDPIAEGRLDHAKRIVGDLPYSKPHEIEQRTPRKTVSQIIDRYIHLREEIAETIDQFARTHFTGRHVIGLHYRGTDKYEEAPRVAYSKVVTEIRSYLDQHSFDECVVIFVATDEMAFLTKMVEEFGDRVVYYEDAFRATDHIPLHKNPALPKYHMGKDAVIDCYLLSKTDILFRTSSNLSLFSTFINPDLPVRMLNYRYKSHTI